MSVQKLEEQETINKVSIHDWSAIVRDKIRRKKNVIGQKMVGWFNVGQLFRTANEVVISTIFGRHMDRRGYQALENIDRKVFDYSVKAEVTAGDLTIPSIRIDPHPNGVEPIIVTDRKELWLDYISDLGDGWDSTYSVAYYANLPALQLTEKNINRGEVVIFGGDGVYPTASKDDYESRLERPYRSALEVTDEAQVSHLYAIPGNHDWYDSLVNFSKIFLGEDFFGENRWRTPQDRSYFVLKLPHHWWLVGIDLQLESDIDGGQIDYLKQAAKLMEDGDKIILCSPEPYWIYGDLYRNTKIYERKHADNRLYNHLLEDKVFTTRDSNGDVTKKQEIAVYLAGDLHHYFHLESSPNIHKITAGGGGAFLHPTHGDIKKKFPEKMIRAAFPTFEDSRRLTRLNALFPYLNRTFGFLTSLLYVLASWTVVAFVNFSEAEIIQLRNNIIQFNSLPELVQHILKEPMDTLHKCWLFISFACQKTLLAGMQTPAVIFWVLVIGGGFWLFTDTESKRYKAYAGPLHAIIHVILTFVINWIVFWLTVGFRSKDFSFIEWISLATIIAVVALAYLWNEGINLQISLGCAVAFLVLSTFFMAQHHNPLANPFSWGWDFKTPSQLFYSGLLVWLISYFVSSFVMGFYLWISLNVFNRHSNEAFSSLGIQDWKNFLRMHITENGELEIYPIGIRRVPRKWEKVPLNNGSNTYTPADEDATPPHLIEGPVIVPPSSNFKKGTIS